MLRVAPSIDGEEIMHKLILDLEHPAGTGPCAELSSMIGICTGEASLSDRIAPYDDGDGI
jgi:hypothetical protein